MFILYADAYSFTIIKSKKIDLIIVKHVTFVMVYILGAAEIRVKIGYGLTFISMCVFLTL